MLDTRYIRPTSVAKAIAAHRAHENSHYIAGGTNLVDLMKEGVAHPAVLVDIERLPLRGIEEASDGGLRIGALVPNAALARDRRIIARYSVLAEAVGKGASAQIRNQASTGGNLLQRTRCPYFTDPTVPCNKREPGSGCPAVEGFNKIHAVLGWSEACIATHPSDMATALVALGASVEVDGPNGARTIPVEDLHRLPGDDPIRDTVLEPGELILAVTLPPDPPPGQHYLKARERESYAFALVSVAVAARVESGRVVEARVALGSVAHKPWRASRAEETLVGGPATREAFEAAARAEMQAAEGFEMNRFKIPLALGAIPRALELATEV